MYTVMGFNCKIIANTFLCAQYLHVLCECHVQCTYQTLHHGVHHDYFMVSKPCHCGVVHYVAHACLCYLQKYIDIFSGTLGFWLFGYAVSGNTDRPIAGEEQDFIFWFFRVNRNLEYSHSCTLYA